MKRAAIYARYSSELQNMNSIDAQLRSCRVYCQQHNYAIIQEFTDEALSGRSDDRPAFQQMINMAAGKVFDVVVCHKVDRFSRDRYDHSHYKRQLQKASVKLEYVEQRIDDTPEGNLTESLLVGLSEYYSRNLARETMKGLNERAYKALFNGGNPPLGYDVIDGQYVINEKEAGAIRFIFARYVDGWGYDKISLALNEMGFEPKRGGRFGRNSLHDILKNEKYIGIYRFGRVRRTIEGRRNSHQDNEEAIAVHDAVPPIIDLVTWKRVREKAVENKKRAGAFTTRREYMLSGLMRCGKCGAMMIGSFVGARNDSWYKCSAKSRKSGVCDMKQVKCSKADAYVISVFEEYFFNPNSRQELCDVINEKSLAKAAGLSQRLKETETELKAIRSKQSNLIDALEDGLLSPEGKDRLRQLNARETVLVEETRRSMTEIQTMLISPPQIASLVADAHDAIQSRNPQRVRDVLKVFADSITYDGKRIEVALRILVSGAEGSACLARIQINREEKYECVLM